MAVPYGKRFAVEFDEVFPQGAYVVGEVTAVTEYQVQQIPPAERTGKHAEAKPSPGGSTDVRSAAA